MLGLMKKDALTALLNALGVLPLLTAYWLLVPRALDHNVVFLTGAIIIILLITTLIGLEAVEAKSKGYAFLSILPVSVVQIIAARFVLIFTSAGLYIIYFFLLFRFMNATTTALRLGQAYIILTTVFGLLTTGILYILMIRFRLAGIFRLTFNIIPILIMVALIGLYEINYDAITTFDTSGLLEYITFINTVLFLLAGATAYFGLMLLAVRTMANKANGLE